MRGTGIVLWIVTIYFILIRRFTKIIISADYDNIVSDVHAMYEFDAVFTDLEIIFGDKLPNIRDIIRIYGKIIINSFAVQDKLMRPIGRAVYLGYAKI